MPRRGLLFADPEQGQLAPDDENVILDIVLDHLKKGLLITGFFISPCAIYFQTPSRQVQPHPASSRHLSQFCRLFISLVNTLRARAFFVKSTCFLRVFSRP
jgi:hypothetical protein